MDDSRSDYSWLDWLNLDYSHLDCEDKYITVRYTTNIEMWKLCKCPPKLNNLKSSTMMLLLKLICKWDLDCLSHRPPLDYSQLDYRHLEWEDTTDNWIIESLQNIETNRYITVGNNTYVGVVKLNQVQWQVQSNCVENAIFDFLYWPMFVCSTWSVKEYAHSKNPIFELFFYYWGNVGNNVPWTSLTVQTRETLYTPKTVETEETEETEETVKTTQTEELKKYE